MKRDKSTFVSLIGAEQQKIKNLIRTHVQNPALREDIFQEILLEAWKSYPSFNERAVFGTWLYRIGLNVIYLHYRRKKRTPRSVSLEVVATAATDREKKSSPRVDKLYNAILKLKMVDKTIISAHLDGYSNPEIAAITGLTSNHVGVKLSRIKARLKADLNDETHG